MAAIFCTTCLFMLNRPSVTAGPRQNKIRVPLGTSVSLSRRAQAGRSAEERSAPLLYTALFFTVLLSLFTLSRCLSFHPSIRFYIYIYIFYRYRSFPPKKTVGNSLCVVSLSPSPCSSFPLHYLCLRFITLCLHPSAATSISASPSHPSVAPPRVPRLKTREESDSVRANDE